MLGVLRGSRRLPLLAGLISGAAQTSEIAAIACLPQAAYHQNKSYVPRVRSYADQPYVDSNSTIWPVSEAFVGKPAPDFKAAGPSPAPLYACVE